MLRRPTGIVFLLLLAAACASSGRRGAGSRVRVTLRNYEAGQLFELVSQSHTNAVEYYSQARSDAARKVQSDEVMGALLDELERQGFQNHAQPGRAPSQQSEFVSQSLEVESGETTEHWVVGKGSAAAERQRFRDCMLTFVQVYNLTASYQTLENPKGSQIFPKPNGGP